MCVFQCIFFHCCCCFAPHKCFTNLYCLRILHVRMFLLFFFCMIISSSVFSFNLHLWVSLGPYARNQKINKKRKTRSLSNQTVKKKRQNKTNIPHAPKVCCMVSKWKYTADEINALYRTADIWFVKKTNQHSDAALCILFILEISFDLKLEKKTHKHACSNKIHIWYIPHKSMANFTWFSFWQNHPI